MPVLPPRRRDQRRRVDELGAADRDRALGFPFEFQAAGNALLGAPDGGLRVLQQALLLGDLLVQLLDLLLHSGLLGRLGGARQLTLGVFQAFLEGLQRAFGGVHPGQVGPQPG
jgi:hypothetical protein